MSLTCSFLLVFILSGFALHQVNWDLAVLVLLFHFSPRHARQGRRGRRTRSACSALQDSTPKHQARLKKAGSKGHNLNDGQKNKNV